MHTSLILQSTVSVLAFLSRCRLSTATPLLPTETAPASLEKRCDNPCGYYSQLCCASDETCSTNSENQAVCIPGGAGSWEYYTTVYTTAETDVQTVTSVWSSWVATPSSDITCQAELGETLCGSVCCGKAFVCSDNQCVVGSTSVWATATPPVRGTSLSTFTATATLPFEAPVNTDGSPVYGVDAPDNGGLSGGAIAGIVIGTLAGVFFLLLVCACLCCRGIIDVVLGCLGIGGRRRRETTYVEDHYSHHTHGAPEGRTWFGARPSGTDTGGERKSRWSSLATIGIVLGAIALCLGLRRRKEQDEKSDYTYPSSYYYTSTTSSSSDRRTRQSRRSERSRTRTHS